jgi:hypothetical protein
MKPKIKRGWIVVGWLAAMVASALFPLAEMADRIETNPLGNFVDPITGAWRPRVYWQFLSWWLPIAVPVSLLAAACMFLNWPADKR